jgi:hypothetical protein
MISDMRNAIYISAMFLLFSCGSPKKTTENTAKQPEAPVAEKKPKVSMDGVESFLTRLEQAILLHDRMAVMGMMDKDYKKERHDVTLKGNTEQFLNDLSCGYQTNGQGSKCIKFNDITQLTRVELVPNGSNYSVAYHVTSKEATVKVYWMVTVKREGGSTMLGLYAFH